MVFTGFYEHTIDAKNRLAIPSEIRKQLIAEANRRASDGETDGTVVVYVTPDPKTNALMIWPEARFAELAKMLDQSPRSLAEVLPFERTMFPLTARSEMDKQGRIRLSDFHLKQLVKLDSDVAVIGVNDHLEVWSRDAWMANLTQTLEQSPHLLMHPREALRNEPTPGSTAPGSQENPQQDDPSSNWH